MEQHYPFQVLPLPYAASGLEPYIDTRTMIVHHDKMYADYVDKLNSYIETKPQLQGVSLDELVKNYSGDEMIRRYAGGVFNHEFFFSGLRPGISQIVVGLSGRLLSAIARDFGSLEGMREQFNRAANDVFGSGYAWLCMHPNGRLVITQTADQDCPLTFGLKPLLCLDVWEHGYFLKYLNVRADYINNFWNVVDWVKVSERLGN